MRAAKRARERAANPFSYRPVLDGTVLAETGLDAARQGKLSAHRLLLGTNRDEYELFARRARLRAGDPSAAVMKHVDSDLIAADINRRYQRLLPDCAALERRTRLMTAEEYWIPTVRLADAHAAQGGETYAYRFDWAPNRHPLRLHAAHFMEVPFVFGTHRRPIARALTLTGKGREKLADMIASAWAHYVHGHAPQLPGVDAWPRYTTDREVMILNNQPELAHDPRGDERELWHEIIT